jgi:hypothetical protein
MAWAWIWNFNEKIKITFTSLDKNAQPRLDTHQNGWGIVERRVTRPRLRWSGAMEVAQATWNKNRKHYMQWPTEAAPTGKNYRAAAWKVLALKTSVFNVVWPWLW